MKSDPSGDGGTSMPQTLAACQQLVQELQAQNAALRHTCDLFRQRLDQVSQPRPVASAAEVHQLQERVKELTCLYAISDLLQHGDLDLATIAAPFVDVLAAAYQYPEVCCARLDLFDWSRATANYAVTSWQQASPVVADGAVVGELVVGYLTEQPEAGEGPFLVEERKLIDECARQLGDAVADRSLRAARAHSEAFAHSILSSTPDTIVTVDRAGCIQYINHAPAGNLAADVLGRPALDFVALRDHEMVRETIAHVFATGETLSHEMAARRPEGAGAPYAGRFAPIWRGSTVDQVLMIAEDITDRKDAESKLGYLAAVLKYVPDAVISVDTDLRIRSWNPYAERMYGWAEAEVIGHALDDVCRTQSAPVVQGAAIDALSVSGIWRGELVQQHRDGRTLFVEGTSAALYDAEGTHIGYVTINSDITERKLAAETLVAQERRFRILVENIHDGIELIDAAGQVVYVSPAAERILDATAAELKRSTLFNLHAEDVEATAADLERFISEDSQVASRTLRFVRKNGEIRWIEATATNLLNDPVIGAVVVIIRDVTERRKAEADLAASNSRFANLFATMTLGIVYQEADGHISLVNHAAEEILGLSIDALQGRTSMDPLWRAVREDGSDYPGDQHPAMVALRTGEIVRNAIMGVYHPAKGEMRWIEIDAVPEFRPGETQPFRVFAIFNDITETRRAQEAVAESEARYRRAIAAVGAVPYSLNLDENRYEFMAPEIQNIYGYSPAEITPELLGTALIEAVLRGDLAGLSLEEGLERFRSGEHGALWQCDFHIRDRWGRERWISDNAVQFFDAHGNAHTSLGIMLDITERKQAEAGLRASEEKYRQLAEELEVRVQQRTAELQAERDFARQVMDTINQGLVISDMQGRALYANPYMAQMLECTPADLIGRTIDEFTAPADLPLLKALFPKAAETAGFQFELHMKTLQSRVKHMLISSVPHWQGGVQSGRISAFADLTGIKQIELDLRQSRDELSAANLSLEKALRLKDEFLANMSHELRTPLTGILGLSEALQMQTYGLLNERQLRAVETVWQSGQHLLELINDILDLSKLESVQVELELEACNVSDICRSSLSLVKGMARQKEQQVDFRMDPGFIDIVADPRRLKQMLANLLSNAVKFTPAGGALGLRVQGDAANGVVRFCVWDKGIGIAPEDLPRLFQPFVQLDSGLARQYSGTGLGLALVQRMAALHGGAVEVTSAPGQGSSFTLVLPWRLPGNETVLHAENKAPVANAADRAAAGAAPAAGAPLVLVVEDNKISADLLADSLELQGYRVAVADNGLDAVAQAIALDPALILMDLQMPRLNGLAAIQQIRAQEDRQKASVPIIVLTAQAMRGDDARGLEAGADAYITKPYRIADVLSAVHTQLERGSRQS